MSPGSRLLLLSCSQNKLTDSKLLPAIERYDGPLFRVLRKFLRECPSQAAHVNTFILSAEYGLIPATESIFWYDRRLTSQRAVRLQPQVRRKLEQVLNQERYKELFICMGQDYHKVLADYEKLIPPDLNVRISAGSLGKKQAELHDWLRGEPPPLPTRTEEAAHIRGVEVALTSEQIIDIAREALSDDRGNAQHYHSWYVQVDEQRVAPKWLVSQITGLPVSAFVTSESLRVLSQLGVTVRRV